MCHEIQLLMTEGFVFQNNLLLKILGNQKNVFAER